MTALMVLALVQGAASTPLPPSFQNIKVADSQGPGFEPCEPSIAVSMKNPQNVVAGVIIDRAISTMDGGKTWLDQHLKTPLGVWGDPTLISDTKGNFYYFHLAAGQGEAWLDRIVCQKSSDGGRTWSAGASIGYNHPADQDKQWATTHPTKPYVYASWTQFDKYGSRKPTDHSNIMFSISKDGGASWSKQLRINELPGDCLDSDNTTEGAVPAVSRDGKIFVAWANQGKIFFDRSYDNGKTWLAHDKIIAEQKAGWDLKIPGTDRSNGMPVLMIDNSGGPNTGSLYLVWGDQKVGDDTDVFFSRSSNNGNTWSPAQRVNKDGPGKQQFLPWMAVDQTTGNIYIDYYDRRAYDDLQTDVYVAYSVDGGKSFVEKRISESPFTPTDKAFFGDYTNISAHGGVIAPIWGRMDKGRTTVWTAMIREKDLLGG
jgi:hypothetical protein